MELQYSPTASRSSLPSLLQFKDHIMPQLCNGYVRGSCRNQVANVSHGREVGTINHNKSTNE